MVSFPSTEDMYGNIDYDPFYDPFEDDIEEDEDFEIVDDAELDDLIEDDYWNRRAGEDEANVEI